MSKKRLTCAQRHRRRRKRTKANNLLNDFYEKHDTGNIRELVKFYGLGSLVEKILLGEGCKTGLDVLKLELSKIRASHKYQFGEQTLGKLDLLQQYLRIKYGQDNKTFGAENAEKIKNRMAMLPDFG